MLINSGDGHAANIMVIDILQYQLLGGKLTLYQPKAGQVVRFNQHFEILWWKMMWSLDPCAWSSARVYMAHWKSQDCNHYCTKDRNKATCPLQFACTLLLRAQTISAHLSFHGGKSTWLFLVVGNDMRLSVPIAVGPPQVQPANSLSSWVNKPAWEWKKLSSLHNSPDVSWLEAGTDLLRGFVSRFSMSPATTAVFPQIFLCHPGKTAGCVFSSTVKEKFLVITTGAEAGSKPSSGFVALSHLKEADRNTGSF